MREKQVPCEECCTKIYHRSRRKTACSANSSSTVFTLVASQICFLSALSFIIILPGVLPSNSASVLLLHYFYSPALAYYEQALSSCLLAEDTFCSNLNLCGGEFL